MANLLWSLYWDRMIFLHLYNSTSVIIQKSSVWILYHQPLTVIRISPSKSSNSSTLLLLFPCRSCYYAQIMLIINFNSWENTSNSKRDKHPSHWCLSLPTLHYHCCQRWSECHCPDGGRCWTHLSEFNQLIPLNLFVAMWQFACHYSSNMLKCFWLAIISIIFSTSALFL